jgi:phenylacetate-CoA ligase
MSIWHTHLILPLAEPERYQGFTRRMRRIRRFEQMPAQDQQREQKRRLQKLLQHAYDTVPFYRKRFDDAGFHPSMASLDSPLPIPVLTRNDLREQQHSLLSTAFAQKDLRQARSGGTTSTPIQFYRDVEGIREKTALQWSLNEWSGYRPGDSVLMLWGANRDLTLTPNWKWRLYEEKLMRRIPAPSGVITDEILERFRERYETNRPKVLYAYSTVLATFAAHLRKHGMRHRPQVLIATAEVMDDENRALIESVFGIPVSMYYGSREVGMIAAECSTHDRMHFHPWSSLVEFDPIGDTPDGPAYRLLVTDLLNYGQPLIRYDTGDCVTLSDTACACGRAFLAARKILGRVCEGILLPDGGIIPGTTLSWLMGLNFRSIARVQFVQKSLRHIHIKYVVHPSNAGKEEELSSICKAIDALMGEPVRWTLEQVPEIPRERSGKIRLCLSEVEAPKVKTFAASLVASEPGVLVRE